MEGPGWCLWAVRFCRHKIKGSFSPPSFHRIFRLSRFPPRPVRSHPRTDDAGASSRFFPTEAAASQLCYQLPALALEGQHYPGGFAPHRADGRDPDRFFAEPGHRGGAARFLTDQFGNAGGYRWAARRVAETALCRAGRFCGASASLDNLRLTPASLCLPSTMRAHCISDGATISGPITPQIGAVRA